MPRLKSKPKLARAVHANRGVECWYRECLQDITKEMAQSMLYHVRAAWKCANVDIGMAADAPSGINLLQRALAKWGKIWTRKLDTMSDEIAARFTNKAFKATESSMRQAFKDGGFTVRFNPTKTSLEAYRAVAAEQVGLIRSIPRKYLDDVRESVWSSVRVGGDLDSLSKELKAKYAISYRRAALIARDQNNKAKAVIEDTRRKEIGVDEAEWQHSGGGKEPRPAHVEMDGKRYKIGKGMWDKDEKKWVWPGTLINCRCTSRAVIPGFT